MKDTAAVNENMSLCLFYILVYNKKKQEKLKHLVNIRFYKKWSG